MNDSIIASQFFNPTTFNAKYSLISAYTIDIPYNASSITAPSDALIAIIEIRNWGGWYCYNLTHIFLYPETTLTHIVGVTTGSSSQSIPCTFTWSGSSISLKHSFSSGTTTPLSASIAYYS